MLLALAASVGVGSGLWHTLATPWAMLLDVVPILFFLVWFLWLYARNVMRMPTPVAVASMVAFLSIASFAQGSGEGLNGSLAYAPALVAVLALGVFHARRRSAARFSLLAAAGVYAIALVFHALDQEVCSALPIGTHFLWHSLSGLTAYLAMRCLVLSRAARIGPGAQEPFLGRSDHHADSGCQGVHPRSRTTGRQSREEELSDPGTGRSRITLAGATRPE